MLTSYEQAIALTAAEQAIDENGCRDEDDICCHVEGIAEMHGDEIAKEAESIIRDMLSWRIK